MFFFDVLIVIFLVVEKVFAQNEQKRQSHRLREKELVSCSRSVLSGSLGGCCKLWTHRTPHTAHCIQHSAKSIQQAAHSTWRHAAPITVLPVLVTVTVGFYDTFHSDRTVAVTVTVTVTVGFYGTSHSDRYEHRELSEVNLGF